MYSKDSEMPPAHAWRLDRVARHLQGDGCSTVTPACASAGWNTAERQAANYHTPEAHGRGDRVVRPRALPARGLRSAPRARLSRLHGASGAVIQAVHALNDEWLDHGWHAGAVDAGHLEAASTAPPLTARQRDDQAHDGYQLLDRMLHNIVDTTEPLGPSLAALSPHLSTSSDMQG